MSRFSSRWKLAANRADRIDKIQKKLLEAILDPTTDEDVFVNCCVTYSELEHRLEKIQERNYYKGAKKKGPKLEKWAEKVFGPVSNPLK